MATVHIVREHHLNENTVRQHIEVLADQLATHLSADYQWRDNYLEFQRTGASGYLQQTEGRIEIYIKLGLFLTPLKGNIEKTIGTYLDNTLA